MVSENHTITVRTILPLLALLAWPAAGCQPSKPHITVSKETTWITEPLNADGTVNYVAAADAWLSKGVTRDNNAAILILQAFGRDVIKEEVRETIIKRLELTDFLDANTALVSVFSYVDSTFAYDDVDQALADLEAAINFIRDAPFAARADVTQLAAYVKRNDQALDLLVKASNRPRYYVPYVSPSKPPRMMDCILRVNLRGWFATNNSLTSRAALRARQGKFDAALCDIAAARKLGRFFQQETTAVNAMVGMAVERCALRTMIGLATSGRLDKNQAKALLENLTETPPMPMPSEFGAPIERLFALDSMTRWARDGIEMGTRYGPNNTDQEPEVTIPDVKIDYDLLLRLTNESFAKARVIDALPTFQARDKASNALSTGISKEAKHAGEAFRDTLKLQAPLAKLIQQAGTNDPQRLARLVHEFNLAAGTAFPIGDLAETTRAWAVLARLSAAIAVYRAQHGRYPAKLDALAPAIIPTVPNDSFNEKPLTYRLTKEGYILYSVGKDMKDDGGKMEEFLRGPDLVVEGR